MHGPGTSRRHWFALILLTLCLLWPVTVVAQGDEQGDAGADPPANPLSNLLNRVFGGGDEAGAAIDGDADPDSGEVDAGQAPFGGSSLEARRLAQAERSIAEEDWHSAVESLQWILDQPQDLIVPLEGGMGQTLQSAAEARIGRMPPAGLEVYQSEYGRIAAQLLERSRGPEALSEAAIVANRYFHTAAGKQAAAKVASLLLDRGEYEAAAAWYARLAGDPAFQNSIDWRARASYALVQAGDRASAQPLLDTLVEQPAQSLAPRLDPQDDLAAWILRQPANAAGTPILDDWLTLYGTAAHLGIAPAGDPLLLQRWSHPLTSRYHLVQQIEDLLLDISDSHRAAIPAGFPIVVGGRVAFRTLRGLAVVDIQTGRLLWENSPELTAEGLLTNEAPPRSNPYRMFGGFMPGYGGSNIDQHPLTKQLLLDAAYGSLSSDGRQVFSIESSVLMPPPPNNYYSFSNTPSEQDPYFRDWTSNQIHSYDLITGERLWAVGGQLMEEPFDPPLAGVFFFGPPVAEGEELFAIGEQDEQLHLFALAPETGEPLWSQTIGDVGATIERDTERRLWTCTPAVEGGLVICPTGTGWLVAVNRHTHRIEWAQQFSQRTPGPVNSGAMTLNAQKQLNERWSASAPIVSGGKVFFSPCEQPDAMGQDQPHLICLNVRTGVEEWRRPKGTSLYLAGVFNGRPLVVGRDEVKLLGSDDGLPLWTTPLPADIGPPSGRGLAVGDRFVLPLKSGQLWSIDLQDGTVGERTQLPNGDSSPLGNLSVWRGMLISLSPLQLTGFEHRATLQQEIAARLAANPADVRAAVKQAEMERISGHEDAAFQALAKSTPSATDDAELVERRRRLMFDALIASLIEHPDAGAAEFERAAGLAKTADERLQLERLQVDRAIKNEQWANAFRRCRAMSEEFSLEQMVEDGPNSLRLDVWLGSRFADVTSRAPTELADSFAEEIALLLENSGLGLPAALSLERMYGFHAAAEGFVWRLIEDAAYRKDFAGADLRLQRLIESGDRTTVAAALARLGELLVEFDQPVEAATVYARLAADYGDVLLQSLKTGQETAQTRFASGAVARADLEPLPLPQWSDDPYRVSHYRVVNSEYAIPQAPLTRQFCGPFFERHAFEFDSQSPFLTVVNRSDNSAYWRLPLRTGEPQSYQQTPVVFGQGRQAIVWSAGLVHALSLPDRRILWTRAASDPDARFYSRGPHDNGGDSALVASGSFAAKFGLASGHSQTGMLAVANSRYVACHSRREFMILDPLTGDVLWRRRGVERQTRLLGDTRTLCIIPGQSSVSDAFAVRATDGRPVEIDELTKLLKSTVAVTSSGFVRAERRHSGRGRGRDRVPRFSISAFEPLDGTTGWSHEFSGTSSATFLDDSHMLVMDDDSGACSLLNVNDGTMLELGNAPKRVMADSTEKYAVADARQIYVVLNDARNNFSHYVHPPAIRTSGTVIAFARDGSGVVWEQTVENQNLLKPGLDQSPLLLFMAYDHVHLPDIETSYEKARIMVLDKTDGRSLAEDVRATPSGNYYRVDVRPDEHAIDIYSHNERVRIAPAPPERAPNES